MAERKLDRQIRRQQIAEAALGLVADRGLGRLSMAAVARRVGLVPSAIYRHFKNKDEVILAVLDRIETRMEENVQAAREETPDPLQQIHSLLVRHVRFLREGRAVPQLIFSDDFHHGHPERKARVERILARYLGRIGDFVRQGQEEGKIRADLDPSTVAMMVLGIVVPAGILWHVTEGGFDVTRHAERAWQVLRQAIAAEETCGPRIDVNRSSRWPEP